MFCNLNAPINMNMQFLSFPEDERRDQCWTWYLAVAGKQVIIIANLEPRMSDEDFNKELERLKNENGVNLQDYKFTRYGTSADHVKQSLGEDFANPPPKS